MGEGLAYRRDIDGLRSLAVLIVIAFHYGYWRLPGGFVGVDIFFVISGYLITSQIYQDIERGRFSLLRFYDRRMRRILPLTLLVIIASLAAGYALMIPGDYARLAASAMASAAGFANVYFFLHSGYFDPASDSLPLLHLWSLGVEEQFYLVWPLLLALLTYWSKNSRAIIVGVLALLTLASFAASVALVRTDPAQAFFMLPTRAWELALGALIAFSPKLRSATLATVAGIAGIGLIFFAMLTLHAWSPFPGVNALAPCLGAALIVVRKERADIVSRALSLPPLVFLGKISFSLYVWHWPIIVFYKLYNLGKPPTHRELIALFIVTLALSVLSYFFVEQPFRKFRPRPVRTVATGLGAVVGTFAISSGVAMAEGFPRRFAPEALRYYAYAPAPMVPAQYDACFLTSRDHNDISRFDPKTCLAVSSSKANVLIIGDSHAAQFAEPLRKMFPEVSISQVTASGCTPVVPLDGAERCTRLMERALEEFVRTTTFDDVILSAEWGGGAGSKIRATVEKIAPYARHVTVLGPSVEYSEPVPLLLGKATERRDAKLISASSDRELAEDVSQQIEMALRGTGAQFLSVVDAECDEEACAGVTPTGVPMLFDKDHFTFEGATAVLKHLHDRGLFSWKSPRSS